MEVVAEQTVAVQCEWLTLFEIVGRLEKRLEVTLLAKYILPIISTIDPMVNQTVIDGTQGARHGLILPSHRFCQINSSDPFPDLMRARFGNRRVARPP